VPEPDDDGNTFCSYCQEWVEPEKVMEFEVEERRYRRMRNRGWED